MRICRSLEATCDFIEGFVGRWLVACGLGTLMHSVPRINPRLTFSHCSGGCGHVCSARFQTIRLVFAGHRVRMCSMESTSLHTVQNCLRSKPGMCLHTVPIM